MNTPAQLRLAADILETGHPYEYRPSSCDWLKHDGDVMHHVKMGTPIRPILARPPYEAELHNPDGLTAEQVGVGYRLTVEGESKHPEAEVWAASQWRSTRIFPQWYAVYGTYRLPLSVPWPEQPKPFTLPTPPPGMKWHREDGWTAEMLPPGTRPLVKGESVKRGDEVFSRVHHYAEWEAASGLIGYLADSEDCEEHFIRTTRPLLFTHSGHEWTWHRAGDPCPCAEKRIVQVLLNDGSPNLDPAMPEFWDWEGESPDEVKIIGWRYADAEKKPKVPLGPEDVPPGSALRHRDFRRPWSIVLWIDSEEGMSTETDLYSWEEAQYLLEINRSIPLTGKWNPNAWEPCEK